MSYVTSWIRQSGSINGFSTAGTDLNPSIATDSEGNSYVAFQATGSTPNGGQKLGSGSQNDIVVFKMNKDGTLLWNRQYIVMNTVPNEIRPSIAIDSLGNCYICYQSEGTVSGGTNLNSFDLVVTKLDKNGNVVWVRQQSIMSTELNDEMPKITTDLFNNCYISYHTGDNPSGSTYSFNKRIVIIKIDTDGAVQWVLGPNLTDLGNNINDSSTIATDYAGNVYVSYRTEGTVSGGTKRGNSDIVVVKIDSTGMIVWVKQESLMSTSSTDTSPSIATDMSGNILISYVTSGTVSGGTYITGIAGATDIVVFKMDTNGNVIWIKETRFMNSELNEVGPSIVTDYAGNSYIAYRTNGTISGGTSAGLDDIVLLKMDSNGNVLLTIQQPSINTSSAEGTPSIGVDFAGNVYVTYHTVGTASGGTSRGFSDIVIFKLSSPDRYPPTNIQVTAQETKAIVTWTTPIDSVEIPITSYTVVSNNIVYGVAYEGNSLVISGLVPGSSYNFGVYATSPKNSFTIFSESTIVATSPPPISPVSFPDCTPWVWMDAADPTTIVSSGNSLTSWQNKGTAGSAALPTGTITTGNQTINNRNVITMAPGSQCALANISLVSTSAFAGFFVMRPTTDICASSSRYDLFSPSSGAGVLFTLVNASTNTYTVTSAVNTGTATSQSTIPNQYYKPGVYSMVASASTANTYTGYNGTQLNLTTANAPTGLVTSSLSYILNAVANNSGLEYAEAIIFSGEITSTLRNQIEGYLAWKWGLQAELPAAHPYSPANYKLTIAAFRRPRSFVTTFAGSGTAGTSNDTGVLAAFNNPIAIVEDSQGNFFVADATSKNVRKITPAGVVTTFVTLSTTPAGMTIDPTDNLYITTQGPIVRVTSDGTMTTIGSGGGDADGTLTTATFTSPTGITFDPAGNLYVCCTNKVKRISLSGNSVTTFVGPPANTNTTGDAEGTGSTARFNNLGGISCDSNGNLFVCDSGNNKIKQITPSGNVTILVGPPAGTTTTGTADGLRTDARFNNPYGIYVDKTNNSIYVTENGNHRIRRISSEIVTSCVGPGPTVSASSGSSNGVDTAASFTQPAGILMSQNGSLYVTELSGQRIRRISPGSNNQIGTYSTGYNKCEGIVIDGNGTLYVTDWTNKVVRKVTQHGLMTTFAGTLLTAGFTDGTNALFNEPRDIGLDSYDNLYISDSGNNNIRKITKAGRVFTMAGPAASGQAAGSTDGLGTAARFNTPFAITVDRYTNVYVTEGAGRIRKITSQGNVSTVAGSGSSSMVDGQGTGASFVYPYGISSDSYGNLLVSDSFKIRKINDNGLVISLVGGSTTGSADGTRSSAQFNTPYDVITGPYDIMYVADTSNNTIRAISASGVTTIAGSTTSGSTDGIGSSASFNKPSKLVYDSYNTCLYITDRDNNTVRMMKLYPVDSLPYNNITSISIKSPGLSLGFYGELDINPVYTGPSLPASVSPVLWYDAADASTIVSNGNAVTGWKNKGSASSGGNGTIVGSVTTGIARIAEKNALTFPAGSDFTTDTYVAPSNSVATFVVSRVTSDITSASPGYVTLLTNSTSADCSLKYDSTNGFWLSGGVSSTVGVGAKLANPTNSTALFTVINSGVTTNLNYASLNGASLSLNVYNTVAPALDVSTSKTYVINDKTNNTSQQVCEILRYHGDLTVIQRDQIEAYLTYKWNLSASLPSRNPYSGAFTRTIPVTNMFDMAGKTIVFCYKTMAQTQWARVFDFNSSNPAINIMVTSYGSSDRPRFSARLDAIQLTNVDIQLASLTPATNTQYILTLYYTSTSSSYTCNLYMYNGLSVTALTSNVTINAGLSIQTIASRLFLGRSLFNTDPYFNGSYQKVALYDGNLSTLKDNTIELQKLLVGSPPNTFTANTYTFNTTGQFLPVTVNMIEGPTATSEEITLSGIKNGVTNQGPHLTIASYKI